MDTFCPGLAKLSVTAAINCSSDGFGKSRFRISSSEGSLFVVMLNIVLFNMDISRQDKSQFFWHSVSSLHWIENARSIMVKGGVFWDVVAAGGSALLAILKVRCDDGQTLEAFWKI